MKSFGEHSRHFSGPAKSEVVSILVADPHKCPDIFILQRENITHTNSEFNEKRSFGDNL